MGRNTLCITSVAAEDTAFTCWLRVSRRDTRSRSRSGAASEIGSRTTQHFLMRYGVGNWTIVWIMHIEFSIESLKDTAAALFVSHGAERAEEEPCIRPHHREASFGLPESP